MFSLQRRTHFKVNYTYFRRLFCKKGSPNSDECIAKAAVTLPIDRVLQDRLGLSMEKEGHSNYSLYGRYKAKLTSQALENLSAKAKLVVVTAMTPTKAGEGKTCTSVGLADGLNLCGASAMVALREPSLGPVFGLFI